MGPMEEIAYGPSAWFGSPSFCVAGYSSVECEPDEVCLLLYVKPAVMDDQATSWMMALVQRVSLLNDKRIIFFHNNLV